MHIVLNQFQGPIALLLELIEKEKLDISQISLAQIANQYVSYVERQKNIAAEDLIGFLDIASRLLTLKLRLILPFLSPAEEEESQTLAIQLKLYQEYYLASKKIEEIIRKNQTVYSNLRRFKNSKFIAPKSLNLLFIKNFFEEFLKTRQPFKFPAAILRRVVSISERIKFLQKMLLAHNKLCFQKMIGANLNKLDIIIYFVALLELVKRSRVKIYQDNLFGKIEIAIANH